MKDKNKKVGKKLPSIDTVWKKEFLTQSQFNKIKSICRILKRIDLENEEEARKIIDQGIKIINSLLERAVLLDAYKDMTADLYCTPNISLVSPNMRGMFIFLGPDNKQINNDREWRSWKQ